MALLMGVMLAILVATPRTAEAQGEPNAGCPNELFGSDGPDELVGTGIGDRIRLLGGDDRGFGAAGDDCLDGGSGNDVLDGGVGSDLIEGQAGGDVIVGGVGDDTIEADPADGTAGNDNVNAGDGNDDVSTGGGTDLIVGGPGNDRIDGGLGQNSINAGTGNDVVASVNGIRERINCGAGRDRARLDVDDRAIGCESIRRLASPTPTATPRIGKERTTFSIRFEAPFATFRSRGYIARVSGPCGTSFEQEIGRAQGVGEVLRFRIAPRRGNRPGRFCGGTYLVTVLGFPDAPTATSPPPAPSSDTTTTTPTTTTPAVPVAPEPVAIGRAVFRVR